MKSSNYAEFTAFGVYSEEFIDYLINSGYNVWDISSENDIYSVKTSPANYLKIARKAREFRVRTAVVKRKGAYFTLRRYRKRIGVPLGFLAFFAIIVVMSNFIWSIKITGNSEISGYQITEQLEKSGIKAGVSINGFDANLAEVELSLAFEKLAWVSIERSGSRLNVKVSERTDGRDENDIPVFEPCNVVAGRSGQLVDTEVYRGRLLYEKGSGINAGDIIVSGVINDGAGGLSFVHADAKLIAECVETAEFYQSYTSFQSKKNGYADKSVSWVFLGMRFTAPGSEKISASKYGDNVGYSEELAAPSILGFPLPYRVLTQNYVYYDRVEVTDPPATALEKLNSQIELYGLNFLGDAEIITCDVEYFPDDEGISAKVVYVFRVDIAEKREISVKN